LEDGWGPLPRGFFVSADSKGDGQHRRKLERRCGRDREKEMPHCVLDDTGTKERSADLKVRTYNGKKEPDGGASGVRRNIRNGSRILADCQLVCKCTE
jgi:hypothetical protein